MNVLDGIHVVCLHIIVSLGDKFDAFALIQSVVLLSWIVDFALSIAAWLLECNCASGLCRGLYIMLHSLHSVNPFSEIDKLNVVWIALGLGTCFRFRFLTSNSLFLFAVDRLIVFELASDNMSAELPSAVDPSRTSPKSSSSSTALSGLSSWDVARDIIRVVSLRFFRFRLDIGGEDGGVVAGSVGSEVGSGEESELLGIGCTILK